MRDTQQRRCLLTTMAKCSVAFLSVAVRRNGRSAVPAYVQAFTTTTKTHHRASPRVSFGVSTSTPTRLFSASDDDTPNPPPGLSSLVNGRISRTTMSSNSNSLDAKTLTENLPLVLSHLLSRRASPETIISAERIATLNAERVVLINDKNNALQERKVQSTTVGNIMKATKGGTDGSEEQMSELEGAKAASTAAGELADELEGKLAVIEGEQNGLLAALPNLLDDVVPDGSDESENALVMEWGDVTALPTKLEWGEGFTPAWHDDLAVGLNGWMADEAVAMSGARFSALKGNIARLERALSSFFLDTHVDAHGYTEAAVPLVVSRSSLEGTSQLPKFEDDLFKITPESHTCNGEDAFLIPTAEVPLTNLHRDSILEESELPLKYCALTPCFRAEAGSYGRDTRGLIRSHQFYKVEMVQIVTPSQSAQAHEELTQHAQNCLEALELPYRKVRLCSGDIGFGACHCYDLEVWLPGEGQYREISSCSNTGDFQARRMGLRYRPSPVADKQEEEVKDKGKGKKKKAKKIKPELCHTLNGSGLAVGRALVAVLENYQTPNGSVVVPKVLQPYMGGLEILTPE
mmetsp:Transcript_12695/g.14553  ORF Transcript_12695/g.14553 Transcript_12695/m.14553 type:complete len:577 (-) Transcript_12695:65-1795(-)